MRILAFVLMTALAGVGAACAEEPAVALKVAPGVDRVEGNSVLATALITSR